jgi:hypothetical protein
LKRETTVPKATLTVLAVEASKIWARSISSFNFATVALRIPAFLWRLCTRRFPEVAQGKGESDFLRVRRDIHLHDVLELTLLLFVLAGGDDEATGHDGLFFNAEELEGRMLLQDYIRMRILMEDPSPSHRRQGVDPGYRIHIRRGDELVKDALLEEHGLDLC